MKKSEKTPHNLHRSIPSVDALLLLCPEDIATWGRSRVTEQCREIIAQLRRSISLGEVESVGSNAILSDMRARLRDANEPSLIPVINLTGTVLHTNLGRASLPQSAIDVVMTVAGAPTNLEFDLDSGVRGDRESHVENLICELTGAEAATAVNNNAAAVLLVLNTLAMNKEVPVSRGELVEIGGSFRIPEVMQRSNCTLVEIGATNRTHLKDYVNAINTNTALLMKVHASNYRVEGFTKEVAEAELAALAHAHKLPFVIDLGSGNLIDYADLGLPEEPTASAVIQTGADVITFSGDKLLGGPQAGVIAGRKNLIEQIKKNPLKRALRLDKMTLAALAEVLKLYRHPEKLLQELPVLRHLTRSNKHIQEMASRLREPLATCLGAEFEVGVQPCRSQIGSGSLPVETLPSSALHIVSSSGDDARVRRLAETLRGLPMPIIGRVHQSAVWLDCRCLDDPRLFLQQLAELKP